MTLICSFKKTISLTKIDFEKGTDKKIITFYEFYHIQK